MSPKLIFAKIASVVIFISIFVNSGIESQGWPKYDQRGSLSENYSSQGLAFYLSANKSRFVGKEPIPLDCRLKNEGLYPITIYLNNQPFKNYTFVIRDALGKSIPLLTDQKKGRVQDALKKESFYGDYTATDYDSRAVVLQPGESMTRTFNLLDFIAPDIELANSTELNVMAYFYPNPEQAKPLYIGAANEYSIYINPAANFQSGKYYAETGIPTLDLRISPKEVVYLMLTAEYEKNWRNYFKYLDLHEVIRDYPDFARQYIRANPDKKSMVIEDFKKYIMGSTHHHLLKFDVMNENIENQNATVTVKAMRKIDGFDRDFVYTYYLSAHEKLWQISGVDTQLKN